MIYITFPGETYDESEAQGEPLGTETQLDPVVLPGYGAPAPETYSEPQSEYEAGRQGRQFRPQARRGNF